MNPLSEITRRLGFATKDQHTKVRTAGALCAGGILVTMASMWYWMLDPWKALVAIVLFFVLYILLGLAILPEKPNRTHLPKNGG